MIGEPVLPVQAATNMEGKMSSPPFLYRRRAAVALVCWICDPLRSMINIFRFNSERPMLYPSVNKLLTTLFLSVSLLLAGCGEDSPGPRAEQPAAGKPADPDVIARVGDQQITFSELNTMLNSSAMVGLSIPALGTPERHQVIMTLLDKVISANLIYLDAKKKGTDRLTVGESASGDIYAGHNGNVYKKTEDGWEAYDPSSRSWESQSSERRSSERQSAENRSLSTTSPSSSYQRSRDYSQLNRDAYARHRGYDRYQQRRAAGGRYGGRRGGFGGRRR